MGTHTSHISSDKEPTPEFSEKCMRVIKHWEKGELPVDDVNQTLKSLAQEAAASGHTANQARAEHLQGYMQAHQGNYNGSILHYKKARRLFNRVNNRAYIAKMDLNQGENYRYKGEFKRARRLYRSAYEAASDLGDQMVQTFAIINEGLTLISLNDYSLARQALQEGLALVDEWDEASYAQLPGLLTEAYHGLATIELAQEDPDKAWEYALQSLDHALRSQNKMNIGFAYRIVGDVMTELDDTGQLTGDLPQTPDEAYRAALSAFKDIGAEGEIGRTIFSHARSFARRGRRSHAAKLFREAMVVFTRHGMTDDAAKAAEAQLRVL
jgi:tetratricopeptide (TPR) repeat protein